MSESPIACLRCPDCGGPVRRVSEGPLMECVACGTEAWHAVCAGWAWPERGCGYWPARETGRPVLEVAS